MDKTTVYSILLAGGSGTRLWPLSRELYPKQLVKFIGSDSLIQNTVKRLTPVLESEKIRIVCGIEHFHEIARHLQEINLAPEEKLISEPCARNTAPAILLAMLRILEKETDAVLCVFPADHVIQKIDAFHHKLRSAIALARAGYIVTFGIEPHYPETGYGYIEGEGELKEGALRVKRFVEKPDLSTAEKYLRSGRFFWNSGMFAFKASVMMQDLATYQPELLGAMKQLLACRGDAFSQAYQRLPNLSIDVAVMEKTGKAAVLPAAFGWSDIGSWKSLHAFLPKDANKNVLAGDVIAKNADNCLIMGHERLIAVNNLRDLVVVETPDAVFVSDLESSRDVKSIVDILKQQGRKEIRKHKTVHHPWGTSTVLEQKDGFRVARYAIDGGASLTVNTDDHTCTYLVIVKGAAEVEGKTLATGQSLMLVGSKTIVLENTDHLPLQVAEISLQTLR